MKHNPEIVQRALQEAARLTAGGGEGGLGSAHVLGAIRSRIVGLESDLSQSQAMIEQLQGDLKIAREEGSQAVSLAAKQLVMITEKAAAELLEVQDVATRSINDIRAAADQDRLRMQAENDSLTSQLEAKTREAEGLSEALKELLSGIQHSKLAERREREEVDMLIGGIMDMVAVETTAQETLIDETAAEVFSAVENIVMGAMEGDGRVSGEVIPLHLGRVA